MGEKSSDLQGFELKPKWEWVDEWTVDLNRGVDNDGWEYCREPSMGGWCSTDKLYHLLKRRRWIRNRKLVLFDKNTETVPIKTIQIEYFTFSTS